VILGGAVRRLLQPSEWFLMRDVTLVFDLDGTLVDTAPDLIRAANHVLSKKGVEPVSPSVLRPEISFGARHIIGAGLRTRGVEFTEAELDTLLEDFLVYYADNISVDSKPFDGLIDVLETYGSEGATLAVCTNKREYHSRVLLEALGLLSRFKALAGRDTFPVCKPHPDHLLNTIKMANGNPKRAIMVGDSDVDISTAKAAKIPVIGVTFGYTHIPVPDLNPDAVIDDYSEFRSAAEAILKRL
jgi:phosphoglycolate phosphatase